MVGLGSMPHQHRPWQIGPLDCVNASTTLGTDLSPLLHELEATEETPHSRIQPDRGTRAKTKDPGFHYTA
ncbi:unnamed protein product [Spirodela intermedia]|uniref:Uncharacterized protein n=1 Tax=Spirodela intermedia TaxID=51605 RepID=A0A7I8KV62_SPIIN|nr:unnamed protein product [Spirodela intermedia]